MVYTGKATASSDFARSMQSAVVIFATQRDGWKIDQLREALNQGARQLIRKCKKYVSLGLHQNIVKIVSEIEAKYTKDEKVDDEDKKGEGK